MGFFKNLFSIQATNFMGEVEKQEPAWTSTNIKFYPCEKIDCKLYFEWSAVFWEKEPGKKTWFDRHPTYQRQWNIYGCADCGYCEHFKKLNIYMPREKE